MLDYQVSVCGGQARNPNSKLTDQQPTRLTTVTPAFVGDTVNLEIIRPRLVYVRFLALH